MSNAPNDAGFSLVEALVALAVFAMAGVGLVQLQSHSLSTFQRVETRALADIIAQNELTEIISARAQRPVAIGERQVRFAGRDWRVETEIVTTPSPQTRRAVVEVGLTDAPPVSRVSGFFVSPEPVL
nr:type II secretion system minor pseudopilin GspI [Nitrosomonas nitrosa]